MLNEAEGKEFFEGLCRKLESEPFDRPYFERSAHRELTRDVTKVVRDYRNSKPYRDKVQVYGETEVLGYMIKNVEAFGYTFKPDISVLIEGKPYVAIDVKPIAPSSNRRGGVIKLGIGQVIIYRAKYDYAILFYLNQAERLNLSKREFDEKIKLGLWDNYKIKVITRYEPIETWGTAPKPNKEMQVP